MSASARLCIVLALSFVAAVVAAGASSIHASDPARSHPAIAGQSSPATLAQPLVQALDLVSAATPDSQVRARVVIPGLSADSTTPSATPDTPPTVTLPPLDTAKLNPSDFDAVSDAAAAAEDVLQSQLLGPNSPQTSSSLLHDLDTVAANAADRMITTIRTASESQAANTAGLAQRRSALLATVAGSIGMLGMSVDLFNSMKPGADGTSPSFTNSSDDNGVHVEVQMQPKISGAAFEATVSLAVSGANAAGSASERTNGKLKINFCPDPNGVVNLELWLAGNTSLSGSGKAAGVQYDFHSVATGQVDDDANLATVQIDNNAEFGMQPASGRNKWMEWDEHLTINGWSKQRWDVQDRGNRVRRARLDYGTDAEATLWMRDVSNFELNSTLLVDMLALSAAQKLWQAGRCLEILAPTPNEVAIDSSMSFQARLRHKIEDVELNYGILARLQGEGSVAPEGVKVPARARFTYTAPDHKAEAAVALESRSKRGVAKLEVMFNAAAGRYLLDFETNLLVQPEFAWMKLHVRARDVPVDIGNPGSFPVSQPLELLSFTGELHEDCTYSSDMHHTRPFTVHAAKRISTETDGRSELTDFEIDISTGDIAGSFSWRCTLPEGGVYVQDFPVLDGELSGLFTVGHVPEAVATDEANRSVIRIKNWQISGDRTSASKTYSRGDPVAESTTFKLRRATD